MPRLESGAGRSNTGQRIELSIVIPVFNEKESLGTLYRQLIEVLEKPGKLFEIIFVDDGSTDGSFKVLKQLHERDSRVRVIRLRRNFGQTAAFSAGFEPAQGEIIVTMDADLQNNPRDIPQLLEKLDEGFDVVSGWRYQRRDPFLTRRLPSRMANRLISLFTRVRLHDYGCSLKAYRREVLENIRLYGEMHRFIPALASWIGIEVAEVKVHHEPRKTGKSKYGMGRVIRVLLDLITVKFLLDFSTRPIQIFGLLGGILTALGFSLAAYLSVLKLAYGQNIADRPLLLLAVLLLVLGVQLVSMGLLGELIARIYHESQDKPTYMVREVLWKEISPGEQADRITGD